MSRIVNRSKAVTPVWERYGFCRVREQNYYKMAVRHGIVKFEAGDAFGRKEKMYKLQSRYETTVYRTKTL